MTVYFLGIGGIGMSALARYFKHGGCRVAGYDRTSSTLTRQLQQEGIPVHFSDLGQKVRNLAGEQETTLVVFTPALPSNHREWTWLRENGYHILKRSQVLGMICNQGKCLAVAGTHGKTTISAMVANILKLSKTGCGAFLGGISKNFRSNFILPGPGDQWLVTEADEFDRSFLQLTPDIAVITYMDADHLDIYENQRALKESFLQFTAQIRPEGSLVIKKELLSEFQPMPGRQIFTYSLSPEADFFGKELNINELTRCYNFKIKTPSGLTERINMTYPGLLNVENAIAAGAAAFLAGAGPAEIKKGLESYSGVERRFDIRFMNGKTIFIDDYAHHPAELNAFISSVKLLYPGKHITGIFQPHLYSRTRDFAGQFAASLDLLDTAVILPVYPARELPIPGVSSGLILEQMSIEDKMLVEKGCIPGFIRERKPEILLTMGAGDIDLLAVKIIGALKDETDN
jgi:UDP-N-acetylmuramate--alanine ligase